MVRAAHWGGSLEKPDAEGNFALASRVFEILIAGEDDLRTVARLIGGIPLDLK